MPLRTVTATRYITPLREGGSLPAIVEADDDGLYVLKFVGAGQGPRALIAELVAGEIARALGLLVPEIVFARVDAELARTEPDPEIQDLIRASANLLDGSVGLNLALDYLPGSVTFDALAFQPDAELASRIVWFDAFVTNLDRTPRNTNMLVWHGRLWLIDHGAALYFHHDWRDFMARSTGAFALIKDHVLLPPASRLEAADAQMSAALTCVARRRAALRRQGRSPRRLPGLPAAAPGGAARVHRGGDPCPRSARMTMRSCASCRASSAASSSMPA